MIFVYTCWNPPVKFIWFFFHSISVPWSSAHMNLSYFIKIIIFPYKRTFYCFKKYFFFIRHKKIKEIRYTIFGRLYVARVCCFCRKNKRNNIPIEATKSPEGFPLFHAETIRSILFPRRNIPFLICVLIRIRPESLQSARRVIISAHKRPPVQFFKEAFCRIGQTLPRFSLSSLCWSAVWFADQGSLTIVRRSSGKRLGRTPSSPSCTPTTPDHLLDQVDLATDNLPPVDTPDACDKAALRWEIRLCMSTVKL